MKKQKPKGRGDDHKFDYSKITDNIYIGSDLCEGNICPIHSKDFKKLGVCVEINLSIERKETPPEDINLYSWIPVVDGYAPTPDQFDLGTAVINQAIKNKQTVYVHCMNGHGRSPTMVAAYFIRYMGKGVDEAEKLIMKKRPEVHIEVEQRKALEKFEKKCTSKS